MDKRRRAYIVEYGAANLTSIRWGYKEVLLFIKRLNVDYTIYIIKDYGKYKLFNGINGKCFNPFEEPYSSILEGVV